MRWLQGRWCGHDGEITEVGGDVVDGPELIVGRWRRAPLGVVAARAVLAHKGEVAAGFLLVRQEEGREANTGG